MNKDCFWLTDEQFARVKPHLPTNTRGKARVDDRRVISGIIQVLKSGGRWVDSPSVYGHTARPPVVKGGAPTGDWALARRAFDQDPRPDG